MLAVESGDEDREVDVLATLGATLTWAGQSDSGLASLAQAVAVARGGLAGRVRMRRASAYVSLGRYDDALNDLNRALPLLRRDRDVVWEARSLTHRAEIHLTLGDADRAAVDYQLADEIFSRSGQELEYAKSRHNMGAIALVRGQLPAALTYFDEARSRYSALDVVNSDLVLDSCAALLAAGIPREAMRAADEGAAALNRRGGDAIRTADLIFAAANAALYADDPEAARQRAEKARRAFIRQGRDLWRARAELVLVRARFDSGRPAARLLSRAEAVATTLAVLRDEDALSAHLVAGRIARAAAEARTARSSTSTSLPGPGGVGRRCGAASGGWGGPWPRTPPGTPARLWPRAVAGWTCSTSTA